MVNPQKRWNRSDNMNRLLSLLETRKEMRFHDLKEELEVSEPTLAEYVKILEQQKKIEHFDKRADRRHTWYRIKPENREKVEAHIRRFEAVKFIEDMIDPVYAYKEKNGKAIAIFYSGIDPGFYSQATQKIASQIAKVFLNRLKVPQAPGQKTAVVLMVEGKEKGSQ